tara:strand:+ start:61 stop:258 length:198 start_codon:yes stop_codon:yes gene_type:complete
MHLVGIFILLVCFVGLYQCYKWYKRVEKIGAAQEVTEDLKAEEHLKEINKQNEELSSKIKGEENE